MSSVGCETRQGCNRASVSSRLPQPCAARPVEGVLIRCRRLLKTLHRRRLVDNLSRIPGYVPIGKVQPSTDHPLSLYVDPAAGPSRRNLVDVCHPVLPVHPHPARSTQPTTAANGRAGPPVSHVLLRIPLRRRLSVRVEKENRVLPEMQTTGPHLAERPWLTSIAIRAFRARPCTLCRTLSLAMPWPSEGRRQEGPASCLTCSRPSGSSLVPVQNGLRRTLDCADQTWPAAMSLSRQPSRPCQEDARMLRNRTVTSYRVPYFHLPSSPPAHEAPWETGLIRGPLATGRLSFDPAAGDPPQRALSPFRQRVEQLQARAREVPWKERVRFQARPGASCSFWEDPRPFSSWCARHVARGVGARTQCCRLPHVLCRTCNADRTKPVCSSACVISTMCGAHTEARRRAFVSRDDDGVAWRTPCDSDWQLSTGRSGQAADLPVPSSWAMLPRGRVFRARAGGPMRRAFLKEMDQNVWGRWKIESRLPPNGVS